MSRVLSELLGATEPMFTIKLRQLESASQHPGVDIKLISDIAQKSRMKMRELGLDPLDTTGEELYHSLQSMVRTHNLFVAKSIGAENPNNIEEVSSKIVKLVKKIKQPSKVWVLKHSTVKRLLKKLPPKRVMKQLGYRSVDSLLKREDIDELLAASRFIESKAWRDNFIKSYKALQTMDFESRNIKIVELSPKKWGKSSINVSSKSHQNLICIKDLGVIAILPMPVKNIQGAALIMLTLMLYYYNELRAYSSLYKLKQVSPEFAQTVIKSILLENDKPFDIAGEQVDWQILHRHFGNIPKHRHPEIFEPHVQAEDLFWQKAETAMYKLEPALKFWEDMDYCGMNFEGKIVSFNLLDNAINYCNGIDYARSSVAHFRTSLWNEVLLRYLAKRPIENLVANQLDTELVDIEMVEL